MDTLFLYNTKTLKEKFNTKVFAGDNLITKINVQIPDNIGGYPKSECEFNLRAIIPEGNLSYMINPSQPYFYVTNDITEKAQTVKLMMIITHEGNVIGRTNTVDLIVNEPAEAPDPPLTPREEFDEVIAEQRAEIAEQAETISEQETEIEAKDGQISELNDEVSTLEGTVAEQQATIIRQNTTIDELNRRVPPLQTLDPINPTTEQVTYTPSGDNVGFNAFTVNGATCEGLGVNPEYYKAGEPCIDKVGSYAPPYGSSIGGIYFYDNNEISQPTKCIVKNWKSSNNSIVSFASGFPYVSDYEFVDCDTLYDIGTLFRSNIIVQRVVLPQNLSRFASEAFNGCINLLRIEVPPLIQDIPYLCFYNCTSIGEIILPNNLSTIDNSFYNCVNLKTLNIPKTLTTINNYAFHNCSVLENVIIENGFNCNNLNLSASTLYSQETIVSWLEALADRTGETAYTLTMGTTNINKLTAEQRAIATNKNWNLA